MFLQVEEAGRGGGARDAYRDRIGLAGLVLLCVGLALLYFHVTWHRYVARDPTVVPAILLLGTPSLLAMVILFPYRRRGPGYRLLLGISLLLTLVPVVNLVVR